MQEFKQGGCKGLCASRERTASRRAIFSKENRRLVRDFNSTGALRDLVELTVGKEAAKGCFA